MIGWSFSCGKTLELCAIDDENVRPAVVVVIEDSYAGARSFDDVLLGVLSAKDIHHGQAGFLGLVGEVRDGLGRRRTLAVSTMGACSKQNGSHRERCGGERCEQRPAPMR